MCMTGTKVEEKKSSTQGHSGYSKRPFVRILIDRSLFTLSTQLHIINEGYNIESADCLMTSVHNSLYYSKMWMGDNRMRFIFV